MSFQLVEELDMEMVVTECTQLEKVYLEFCLSGSVTSDFSNRWPKLQIVQDEFPVLDVMAYE